MLKYLTFAIISGFIGSLCDKIHIYHNILKYPGYTGLYQPLWCPILFGIGFTTMLVVQLNIGKSYFRIKNKVLVFLSDILCFMSLYWYSGISSLFYILFVIFYVLRTRLNIYLISYTLMWGFIGTFFEFILCVNGIFQYVNVSYYVPLWLPLLYMYGTLVLQSFIELEIFPKIYHKD